MSLADHLKSKVSGKLLYLLETFLTHERDLTDELDEEYAKAKVQDMVAAHFPVGCFYEGGFVVTLATESLLKQLRKLFEEYRNQTRKTIQTAILPSVGKIFLIGV